MEKNGTQIQQGTPLIHQNINQHAPNFTNTRQSVTAPSPGSGVPLKKSKRARFKEFKAENPILTRVLIILGIIILAPTALPLLGGAGAILAL